MIVKNLIAGWFLLISTFFVAQEIDNVEVNNLNWSIDASYSLQFAGKNYHDFRTNYEGTTWGGGKINSFQISPGLVWRKFIFGITLNYQNISNKINYHAYHPNVPLLLKDFDIVYSTNNLGLFIGRNFYINEQSFLRLKGGVSYCFFSSLSSDQESFIVYRESIMDAVQMTSYYYVTPFDNIQTSLGVSLNSQTKIGTFGLGVNFVIIPISSAYGTIKDDPYTRGFSNASLPRGYVGFSIEYQWSKARN